MSKLAMLLVVLAVGSTVLAGESIGWRGDGSGVYPKANPPVAWSCISKSVAALRFQAQPPQGDAASGTAMADGIIRKWLVLGPVTAEKGAKGALTDSLLVEDQSKLSPAADDKAADAQWKAVDMDTAYIDFAKLFDTYGKNLDKSAYALAYVYSPADADFMVSAMHTGGLNLWVNGKPTHKFAETELNYTPQGVKLQKGWNRVLVRSTPRRGAPGERPMLGTWHVNLVFRAAPDKAQYDMKNIAWKTMMPSGEGWGGPIVVGGKLYLLSEPADLVCVDAATGKILWVRSNNYNELATDQERKDQADTFKEIEPLAAKLKEVNDSFTTANPPKMEQVGGNFLYKEKSELEGKLYGMMKKMDDKKYTLPAGQDVGYSGLTPASDGKHIYAWFATGVTCCYDLDGKLIWRRLDNEGKFFEHGYSSSPLLADGKLIITMNKLFAIDAAKSERLWTTELNPEYAKRYHGTPAAAMIGKTPVCILPTGHIVQLSDGKILRDKGPEFTGLQQEMPSPVVMGNTVYELSTYNRFRKVTLPAEMADPLKIDSGKELKLDLSHYPTNYLEWHMASPLIHEGLAYLLNNTGVLTVVDVEKMEVVYEKLLDLDHFQTAHEGAGRGIGISPALAGGRIYLMGNTGVTIVIEPGRAYKQLARNKIENVFYRYYGLKHERFVANPAFDGRRMFIRGERYLYCTEEADRN